MDELNAKKQKIHAELSTEDCYLEGNKARLTALLKEQAEVEKKLELEEEQWMAASEQLEVLMLSLEQEE